jgi:Lower baseplate protein N-terminal domain
LPQGSGYVPAVGGIGLDTAAGLPVVNLGGTTHQVAFTSSNISGQAGTALALAAIPTQCSGAFATGIAANGNANCTTPNVIQLAETAQPAGIPNWGVFWFDAATHTPRIIENNGQVEQLGLSNLFNSDPGGDPTDNLEERNGLLAQNLRVYSSYANNTTWDRISLGSEAIGGTTYNVLRSEDATSGNALSLGMHIGSSIKWFFASDGTFKPNSDNGYDIGTDTGQAMRSVFAKTSFNIYSTGRQDFEFPNDTTNGTALSLLAVYNSGATGVQTAATSSTDGVLGIVSGGAGTSGKAVLTWMGLASCSFDAGSPIAGNYAIASTTQAGKCHDTGSSARPAGVQVIGRIEAGGVRVNLGPPSGGGGGGAVSSVFGRTGAVTASSGDYSVGQVTGAAADSAVVHLAGAETITGSKTFSSDVTLSGNLNVAGNINQTSTSPTQWSGKEWTGTTTTVPTGMDFSLGIGSDNIFKCQLASGASCLPASGGVGSVFGRTGAVVAASGDYSVGQVTGAASLASPVFTGTPAGPTPGAGDNSTKLATTAYVRSETQLAWTCPVAGSTSVSQNCNWTLPAALTITGFDFAANTAPVGCTTYATMQVWDGTASAEVGSYSVTLSSGNSFYSQVTGSANVAAGHLLRIKVTTAGSGCTTNAGGMAATVTYQMQN